MTEEMMQIATELQKFKTHLQKSTNSGWSVTSVSEVLDAVEHEINYIKLNDEIDWGGIQMLILPTSDLQEISIANNWADEYLLISDRIESLIM